MPPDSLLATLVLRMVSKRGLPWSTRPNMVTTAGRVSSVLPEAFLGANLEQSLEREGFLLAVSEIFGLKSHVLSDDTAVSKSPSS